MSRLLSNTLREMIEAALMAATFAEENDAETARELLSSDGDAAGGRRSPGGSDAW